MSKQIHLISLQNWQAAELSATNEWTVDHSYGLDVPVYKPEDTWWLPQAQAVQLLRAVQHHNLPDLQFVAPSPDLLEQLPEQLLGRRVETLLVREAMATLIEWPELWWKLATGKHDKFQAEIRTHEQLMEDIKNANLPDLAYIQNSTSLPEIISEYRFFISKNKTEHVVMTSSGYLRNGVTVYDGAVFVEDEKLQAEQVVADLLKSEVLLPPAFVVDIAVTIKGAYVLEFNPAWCSGWYDASIPEVLETVSRSTHPTPREFKQWGWVPDPSLIQNFGQPERRVWGLP